jgi:magnesium-transporting ATPase (P-type)
MRVKYLASVPVTVGSDGEVWSCLMAEIAGSNPTEFVDICHAVFFVCSVGIVLGNRVITLTVLIVVLLTTRKTLPFHKMELLFISFATYSTFFFILTIVIDKYNKVTSQSPLSPRRTPADFYLWLENFQHPSLNLVFIRRRCNKEKLIPASFQFNRNVAITRLGFTFRLMQIVVRNLLKIF